MTDPSDPASRQPATPSRRATLLGALGLGLPFLLPGGAAAQAARRQGPPGVVATTGMIGDLVREIGGGRARVEVLMGAGVDPHLYKPTRDDMARMLRADLVFHNGLGLEGKMADAFARMVRGGKAVHAVAEMLPEDQRLQAEDQPGHYDPHAWMDPRAWSLAAGLIAEQLSRQDPAGAAQYQAGLAALQERMRALDGYAERALASIPAAQRVLVTAHDAFNYFSRRYGIEVLGIQGLSTESEAGLRRIQELVGLLVERTVPAVFVESSVSDRNVMALVEGAAARGHRVAVGGELFSDAMGEPGSYEGTYIGMIDHNVTVIARALGGQAPARGFQGRLGARA